MKIATLVLFSLLSMPAIAGGESRVNKAINDWYHGSAKTPSSQTSPEPVKTQEENRVHEALNKWLRGTTPTDKVPLIETARELSVSWVQGQVTEKEFCHKAKPLEKEVWRQGKERDLGFRPFLLLSVAAHCI